MRNSYHEKERALYREKTRTFSYWSAGFTIKVAISSHKLYYHTNIFVFLCDFNTFIPLNIIIINLKTVMLLVPASELMLH
jgi:hypothetical protein